MFANVKVWKVLGLLIIAVFGLSIAGGVHAASVSSTIKVGASPTGVAYDSAKGEIFVANSGSNTVSIISDQTNAVIKTVTVGTSPTGVAYDSGKA